MLRHSYTAGGLVVSRNGQILVVNQDGTSWSLPKGEIEAGETTREAAAREIEEESGVSKLNFIKELGTYERYQIGLDGKDNTEIPKTITMFLYTTDETDLQPIDPDNPEARWVKPEEVAALLTHRKDKAFFKKVLPQIRDLIA